MKWKECSIIALGTSRQAKRECVQRVVRGARDCVFFCAMIQRQLMNEDIYYSIVSRYETDKDYLLCTHTIMKRPCTYYLLVVLSCYVPRYDTYMYGYIKGDMILEDP